jgi:hypothetical protein
VPALIGIPLPEFATPFPDGLIGHNDAADTQAFLSIPVAETAPLIEPHSGLTTPILQRGLAVPLSDGKIVQSRAKMDRHEFLARNDRHYHLAAASALNEMRYYS